MASLKTNALQELTISKRGLHAMLFGASGAAEPWIMKLPMCMNDYFWYLTLAELEIIFQNTK